MRDSTFPTILGTATLNEKGQVVIPAEARAALDLKAGSKVVLIKSPHRQALVLLKAEEVEAMLQDYASALNDNK